MNRISNSFVMLLALVACGEAPDISDGPDPASPVEDAHDPTPPRDGLVADGLDVAPEHGVRDADSAQERAQRRFDGDWFGVADCDGAWLDVRLVVASDWEGVDARIAIDGELDVLYGEAEGREVALRSSQRTQAARPAP